MGMLPAAREIECLENAIKACEKIICENKDHKDVVKYYTELKDGYKRRLALRKAARRDRS